jgi:hypothetical protein
MTSSSSTLLLRVISRCRFLEVTTGAEGGDDTISMSIVAVTLDDEDCGISTAGTSAGTGEPGMGDSCGDGGDGGSGDTRGGLDMSGPKGDVRSMTLTVDLTGVAVADQGGDADTLTPSSAKTAGPSILLSSQMTSTIGASSSGLRSRARALGNRPGSRKNLLVLNSRVSGGLDISTGGDILLVARGARGMTTVKSDRRDGPDEGAPIGFGRIGFPLDLASGVPDGQRELNAVAKLTSHPFIHRTCNNVRFGGLSKHNLHRQSTEPLIIGLPFHLGLVLAAACNPAIGRRLVTWSWDASLRSQCPGQSQAHVHCMSANNKR